MSCQMALCYRVLKAQDITPALDFGITADDFIAHEAKALWSLISNYYLDPRSAGSIMDPKLVALQYKGFAIGDDMPGESTQALCAEVRKERVKAEANKAIVSCSQSLSLRELDPMLALSQLTGEMTRLQALGTQANTDMSLMQGIDSVRQRIALARVGVDFSKMPWPWAPLQNETFGIQEDDYVVFYGRPKSMKTWVLVYLIAYAFFQQVRVLVYTKEMTQGNIYMRTLACLLQCPYRELRGATMSHLRPLTPADEQRLEDLAAYIKSDPGLSSLITVLSGRDCGAGMDTVPWLRSKVERYKPALVFIDGLYLLSDHQKNNSDHQRVMHISRDLRDMVLATKIPVIATMQANRKAAGHKEANLDEIAYSDALAQDCTIAARVINDKNNPTISIVIGGSREFELHGFRINAVPATNFDFHSILDENDIKKATEDDHGEEEEKKNAKPAHKNTDSKHTDKPRDTSRADEKHHMNVITNGSPNSS